MNAQKFGARHYLDKQARFISWSIRFVGQYLDLDRNQVSPLFEVLEWSISKPSELGWVVSDLIPDPNARFADREQR